MSTILFHILLPRNSLNRCLKCGNKKSYTEVQISRRLYTFMQNFRSLPIKVRLGHRLRRKKKKSKITAVPPAWFFWKDYRLVVGNLSIVPPLEPCCLPCCNFRFFLQCHCHYKCVKIIKKGVSEGKDDFVCWKLNST